MNTDDERCNNCFVEVDDFEFRSELKKYYCQKCYPIAQNIASQKEIINLLKEVSAKLDTLNGITNLNK